MRKKSRAFDAHPKYDAFAVSGPTNVWVYVSCESGGAQRSAAGVTHIGGYCASQTDGLLDGKALFHNFPAPFGMQGQVLDWCNQEQVRNLYLLSTHDMAKPLTRDDAKILTNLYCGQGGRAVEQQKRNWSAEAIKRGQLPADEGWGGRGPYGT